MDRGALNERQDNKWSVPVHVRVLDALSSVLSPLVSPVDDVFHVACATIHLSASTN